MTPGLESIDLPTKRWLRKNTTANQVHALWLNHSDNKTRDQQCNAAVAALVGIGPKDEIEGMLAAQLVAAHNAAMECYRRAMIGDRTFEESKPSEQAWPHLCGTAGRA